MFGIMVPTDFCFFGLGRSLGSSFESLETDDMVVTIETSCAWINVVIRIIYTDVWVGVAKGRFP